MSACGLDFGTSNTALGILANDVPILVPLENDQATIPSAIFYQRDAGVLIGRAAVDAYVDGVPGRLMRSLKSVLGTSLVDETTQLGRERLPFREIIAYYLATIKRRAELAINRDLRNLVHGRPVHFVDNSPEADRKAEATLLAIARQIGFEDVSFQFEPIAAALDYERQVTREEIALIADIGGGTSDFSIVRLSPERHKKADRREDILANDGVRIGGTDFDQRLSLGALMPLFGFGSAMKRAGLTAPSAYFHELAAWSSINRMYDPRVSSEIRSVRHAAKQPQLFDRLLRVLDEQRGHTLAMEIENAKIELSDESAVDLSLSWVEPALSITISRADFVTHTKDLSARIGERVQVCLDLAGLSAKEIGAVFLTGGSVQLPHVRRAIVQRIPKAKIIDGDTFGAVGKGLTIEAGRRYGSAA